MITVRQIDRLWSAKAYERLLADLILPRPEASDRLLSQLSGPLPAAAMAIIRLDELTQSFVPLYGSLVCTLVNGQRSDGGWGDVMTTALCLRALMCGNGNGAVVDRGLQALAALQKPDGIWPNVPVRRMPVDPFASAFVLLRLGDCEQFRDAVRMDDALNWFKANDIALDSETRRLWIHAQRRTAGVNIRIVKPATGLLASAASGSPMFWDLSAALNS